jgi:hypothetical protein
MAAAAAACFVELLVVLQLQQHPLLWALGSLLRHLQAYSRGLPQQQRQQQLTRSNGQHRRQ